MCAEGFHSKSTAFANVVSDASMYRCVVWIDLCEANSAITRTLTPLFAKFVMNERPAMATCSSNAASFVHTLYQLRKCVCVESLALLRVEQKSTL